MPFFSRNTEPEPEVVPIEPAHEEHQKRSGLAGIFGGGSRERSPSPAATVRTNNTHNTHNTRHSRMSTGSHPAAVHPEETHKRSSVGGLFSSRNRSPSPASTVRTTNTTNTRMTATSYNTSPQREHSAGGGLFRRSTDASSKRGVLQRTFGNGNNPDMDPSIVSARERVMNAEMAEREADRALNEARLRVQEAREHVKNLELEAKEEARRAKIKQYHAREVSKRGKLLGRHDM